MKTFVAAFVILLIACTVSAGEYPCYRSAVPFLSVPADRPSVIALEAQRVVSITGKVMTFDLGTKTIDIEADSAASLRFLRDVRRGRCSASERTTLEPDRISPFNDRYKAVAAPH
jgi:hypothetical protein